MTVGSIFTGVGGFDLGFEQAGFAIAWQCEQDEKAQRVLRHRWPGVPLHDDVRAIGAHNLTPVDVLAAGFPCQDLSVAGKREGLGGARSGLFFEAVRIAVELRTPWVVLENVAGLLSSHRGRDFAHVVETLVDSGYGVAWRVFDSRHFGVAQRRRRVFLVGCLGGQHERAAAVLLEPERRRRHPAPRRETGPGVAATLRGRSSRPGVNAPGRGGEDDANLVAYCLRSDPGGTGQGHNTTYVQTAAVGVHANQRGELRTSDLAGSLTGTRSGKQFEGVMAFDNRDGKNNDAVGTQRADCHGANPMVAATLRSSDGNESIPFIASALTSSMGHHGHSSPRGDGSDNLVAGTLDTNAGDYSRAERINLIPSQGVRRLTPRECERLQGFPDGWTCLCPAQGDTATCVCPDSPRYKQMGNAVTVPVIAWIARRLLAEAKRAAA